MTLFGKPSNLEGIRLMSQRTILLELESPKRGGYAVACCRLLGVRILCSYSSPHRSDHDVPVNLQQHKVILYCATLLSLFEWKTVRFWKVGALRMDCPVYFRLQATFFYKKHGASMTQHRPQGTKVKVKVIDLKWSQVCPSILRLC